MTLSDQLRRAAQTESPTYFASPTAYVKVLRWMTYDDRFCLDRQQIVWFFLFVAEALEDE